MTRIGLSSCLEGMGWSFRSYKKAAESLTGETQKTRHGSLHITLYITHKGLYMILVKSATSQ